MDTTQARGGAADGEGWVPGLFEHRLSHEIPGGVAGRSRDFLRKNAFHLV